MILFGVTACVSLQNDLILSSDDVQQSKDIQTIEEQLAKLDARVYLLPLPDASERARRSADCTELFALIDTALSQTGIQNAQRARLIALRGRVQLIDEKMPAARASYNSAVQLYRNDIQAVILAGRLGSIDVGTSETVSASNAGERALLMLERALQLYRDGAYRESVAQFDNAFLSLAGFYQYAYKNIRDRAWELRDIPSSAAHSDGQMRLLQQQEITIGQMLLLAQNNGTVLFNYTSGKTLSEAELYTQLSRRGLLDAVSEKSAIAARQDKATRIQCARFLWNLFNARKGRAARPTAYSALYRSLNEPPIPDVPLDSPDFDAVLGCIELELMNLPDGIHFFPMTTVSGTEFNTWLLRIK